MFYYLFAGLGEVEKEESRTLLLLAASEIGGEKVLARIRRLLRDPDTANDAVKALSRWSNSEPLPLLVEWFKSQKPEAQAAQMWRDTYAAYEDGKFGIKDMTASYQNDIYGTMRRQPALKELVGSEQ